MHKPAVTLSRCDPCQCHLPRSNSRDSLPLQKVPLPRALRGGSSSARSGHACSRRQVSGGRACGCLRQHSVFRGSYCTSFFISVTTLQPQCATVLRHGKTQSVMGKRECHGTPPPLRLAPASWCVSTGGRWSPSPPCPCPPSYFVPVKQPGTWGWFGRARWLCGSEG